MDELLLQDAYTMRKPVLGICYGLQILNVYRGGTLLQHIESPVNHEAGKSVPIAHTVEVDCGLHAWRRSLLRRNVGKHSVYRSRSTRVITSPQKSPGDGLRVVARCPEDGIIEALEGTSAGPFRRGRAMASGTFGGKG